jgi:hypothetical protein
MSNIRFTVLLGTLAFSFLQAQSVPAPRAAAAAPAATAGAAPFARGEALNFSVNWPSGLSLGEAQMKAGGGEPGWDFEFSIDASLPGFDVRDHYHSIADGSFCSARLEKNVTHGARKTKERVSYDQARHQAKRETDGGGGAEVSVNACVKDGLTFLYYLRRELAAGRLPPPQTINFGSPYEVSVTYGGTSSVEISGTTEKADRITVDLRGPASTHSFEILVARDKARTPLEVRVPFAMGTFALQLTR